MSRATIDSDCLDIQTPITGWLLLVIAGLNVIASPSSAADVLKPKTVKPSEISRVFIAVRDLTKATIPTQQKTVESLIGEQLKYIHPVAGHGRPFAHQIAEKEDEADVVCEFAIATIPPRVAPASSFAFFATTTFWDKDDQLLASVMQQRVSTLRGSKGDFATKAHKNIGEFITYHLDPMTGTSVFDLETDFLRYIELTQDVKRRAAIPMIQKDWFVRSLRNAPKGKVYIRWNELSPAMDILHVVLHRAIDEQGWAICREIDQADVVLHIYPTGRAGVAAYQKAFQSLPTMANPLGQSGPVEIVQTFQFGVNFKAASVIKKPWVEWTISGSTSSVLAGKTAKMSAEDNLKKDFEDKLSNLRKALSP